MPIEPPPALVPPPVDIFDQLAQDSKEASEFSWRNSEMFPTNTEREAFSLENHSKQQSYELKRNQDEVNKRLASLEASLYNLKAQPDNPAPTLADKKEGKVNKKDKQITQLRSMIRDEFAQERESERLNLVAAIKEMALEESTKDLTPEPIVLKDCVGRKLVFPFHLADSWSSFSELVKQAFLHVDIIGPKVGAGQFDIADRKGRIILPECWESLVEPGCELAQHLWPMEEQVLPPPQPVEIVEILEPRRRPRVEEPVVEIIEDRSDWRGSREWKNSKPKSKGKSNWKWNGDDDSVVPVMEDSVVPIMEDSIDTLQTASSATSTHRNRSRSRSRSPGPLVRRLRNEIFSLERKLVAERCLTASLEAALVDSEGRLKKWKGMAVSAAGRAEEKDKEREGGKGKDGEMEVVEEVGGEWEEALAED